MHASLTGAPSQPSYSTWTSIALFPATVSTPQSLPRVTPLLCHFSGEAKEDCRPVDRSGCACTCVAHAVSHGSSRSGLFAEERDLLATSGRPASCTPTSGLCGRDQFALRKHVRAVGQLCEAGHHVELALKAIAAKGTAVF